jgi:hypothetical protein
MGVSFEKRCFMRDPESTRHGLLARISASSDGEGGMTFVEVDSPFVYQFIQRRGLQPADATGVAREIRKT